MIAEIALNAMLSVTCMLVVIAYSHLDKASQALYLSGHLSIKVLAIHPTTAQFLTIHLLS
jgi:hypothetical protein